MEQIEEAESIQNLFECCPLDHNYHLSPSLSSQSLHFRVDHQWGRSLRERERERLFEIFEENMKEMYVRSSWGWNIEELYEEFFSSKSSYLIVFDEMNQIQAYTHFQVRETIISLCLIL